MGIRDKPSVSAVELATAVERIRCQDVPAGAAVAIIRCLDPVESVLLVRRANNRRDPWSGHFAFPGGRKDDDDISIFATCTREVEEETGIALSPAELVSVLPPKPAGRRLLAPVLVQPFLFEVSRRPAVRPAASEIESYFWLETDWFRDSANHHMTEVIPGVRRPVFPVADYYIWGFTYAVLCSLLEVACPSVGEGR